MSIQEQVNLHLKNAILTSSNDVKSILRVLIGEFNRVDKTVSDEKAISIVRKMIENAKIVGNLNEVSILETYLPQQLSEDDLRTQISALIYSNNYSAKEMGKIMSTLKEKYSGKYDGKLASSIAKELLSK